MRFLLQRTAPSLKPIRPIVAATSKKAAPRAVETRKNEVPRSKAYAQRCSPNCGCVIRFEATLSPPSDGASASPRVVSAAYHTRRILAKSHENSRGNVMRLQPLLTSRASPESERPVMTTCSCQTLHLLAEQAVNHMNGRTMAQLQNDSASVTARSSIALRHTILRENVLPRIEERNNKELGLGKARPDRILDGEQPTAIESINEIERRGHCYDLVEDALLALVHERMPRPRRDGEAERYSPTLGGTFRMYSRQLRNEPPVDDTERIDDDDVIRHDDAAFRRVGDWQRASSPSSYFLFGDESASPPSLLELTKESISLRLLGLSDGGGTDARREERPPGTYLELFDMYSDDVIDGKGEESDSYNDWVDFIDNQQTSSG